MSRQGGQGGQGGLICGSLILRISINHFQSY